MVRRSRFKALGAAVTAAAFVPALAQAADGKIFVPLPTDGHVNVVGFTLKQKPLKNKKKAVTPRLKAPKIAAGYWAVSVIAPTKSKGRYRGMIVIGNPLGGGSAFRTPASYAATEGTIVFTAPLFAANEAPPVISADGAAPGTAIVTLDVCRSGSSITTVTSRFEVNTSGLPSTSRIIAQHIAELGCDFVFDRTPDAAALRASGIPYLLANAAAFGAGNEIVLEPSPVNVPPIARTLFTFDQPITAFLGPCQINGSQADCQGAPAQTNFRFGSPWPAGGNFTASVTTTDGRQLGPWPEAYPR